VELSWSTFLLEIVNFLVLVWILKRFLFKPVREIIARRRAEIDNRLSDAQSQLTEAQALKQQYQVRLSDWEAEKRQLMQALNQELEAERSRRLNALSAQIEDERERNRVADARRTEDLERSLEDTALRQGARFAGRLLEEAASAETGKRLVVMVTESLQQLPPAQRASFQRLHEQAAQILVSSAHSLSAEEKQGLTSALSELFPGERSIRFEQDDSLLAGLRIVTGNWVLGCNLRDELAGFAEVGHERR
jgi:F-type H+-transporting ATPase subunit b